MNRAILNEEQRAPAAWVNLPSARWGLVRGGAEKSATGYCNPTGNIVPFHSCGSRLRGAVLAWCGWPESNVFRAAVLSIVLAMTGTPTATLLCRTWCDPSAAAASGCHHEGLATVTIVAGQDGCRNTVLSATSIVQENARRTLSPGREYALPLPRYQLAPSTVDTRLRLGVDWDRSLANQPLTPALRI
jgi:hypothetical protein